jgi:peptidoglycan/xylan/chitin deacetylase (PgdA/CDA1 family)
MLGLLSARFFMSSTQQKLSERGRPIFTYHKIDRPLESAQDPFLYVSPIRFDQQLGALRRAGFVSASLAEVSVTPDNRDRKVVITFDDGCCNVLENGLEILSRHQFRAIQFLVAGFIGKHNEWDVAKGEVADTLMDETQVREWLAAGHEIGSHTSTHPNLKRQNLRAAREEIFGSKKKIEDAFGIPVRHFCYPFGKWNEAVRDLVGEAGYMTACTVRFGVNTSTTPTLELNRIVPLSGTEWFRKARHRLAQKIAPKRA